MLTPEQQKIIEDSQWIVNLALKKQNLSYDNDLRQSALLYLCSCLERFDPSLEIKWTTYAFKNVFLYIKRTHAKEQKKLIAIYENYSRREVKDINELGTNRLEPEEIADQMQVREIKAVCTPREREVLDLKLQGYKRTEICEIMNIGNTSVGKHLKSIEMKAREL